MAASDPTTSPRAEQRHGLSFHVDTRLFEVIAPTRLGARLHMASMSATPQTFHSQEFGTMRPMIVETVSLSKLRPYAKNARTHSKKQIWQIAESIKTFGFTNPVLTSDDDEIIAGHGRVAAAEVLGMENIPTVRLSHLNAAQRRAYIIADNKLALNAGWDREVLAIELQALVDLDFGVEITGLISSHR